MQNGMLGKFLDANNLGSNTQVLLYLAVAKLGEPPIDGITEFNPEGLTAATGKWADAFASRLDKGGLRCRALDGMDYTGAMLEKHVWICAFMLTGALNGGITVGEVEEKHSEQLKAIIDELIAAGEVALGVKLPAGAFDRLAAYGRSVAHFPTAVKEVRSASRLAPQRRACFLWRALARQACKAHCMSPCISPRAPYTSCSTARLPVHVCSSNGATAGSTTSPSKLPRLADQIRCRFTQPVSSSSVSLREEQATGWCGCGPFVRYTSAAKRSMQPRGVLPSTCETGSHCNRHRHATPTAGSATRTPRRERPERAEGIGRAGRTRHTAHKGPATRCT